MDSLKSACIPSLFFLTFLIPCIQSNPAFPNLSLHGKMNSTLLKQTFNDEFDNKEYEIVQLRFLSKRSVDDQNVIRVHLSAFGKDIHLRLQRNDDFENRPKPTKFYQAEVTDTGIQLNEIIFEDDDPGIPYIDPVHMAAITVQHGPDGTLQMDGVIGDDLIIKPAPTYVNYLEDYFEYEDDYPDGMHRSGKQGSDIPEYSSDTTQSGVHIVYRSLMKSKLSSKAALDDVLNSIDSGVGGHRKKRRPLHAWPEVLLMVDSDTYAMHVSHGFNDAQMRRYYISFLNAVDLRFKILSDPKVSLILSQIVIFKSRDATPYLKNNLYPRGNIFNGHRAIRDLANHMYSAKIQQQGIYPEFDVAVLLTKLDMCTDEMFHCNTATLGLAFFKGACTVIAKEERWMGVAIVEDSGGFDGILTAAHEIGHLLGADHDGVSHFQPIAASICSHEDGYIMSNMVASDRIFQWSECSIRQFRNFLSSDRAFCLFNQPNYSNELEGSELPGVVLSLDEQCRRYTGTRACAWDSRVCANLRCYSPKEDEEDVCFGGLAPAAEGSSCGKDLHCRHGKCVSNSLIYSQAWNMAPVYNGRGHRETQRSSTTKKPPFIKEACTDGISEFCDVYFWTIGWKEACENSRIFEECCYSHKNLCKVKSLQALL